MLPAVLESLENRLFLSATYYVSPTGNDANNGRSIAAAWRSIARVNRKHFMPGDKILFQAGKSFPVSGSRSANLLANPGFEESLAGWSLTQGTNESNATITSSAHSGVNAIQLAGQGDAIRAQDVTAKIRPNQTYELDCWTKQENISGGDRRIGITFYSGGVNIGSFYRGFRNTNYIRSTWSFVAPVGFDKAVFWIARTGDNSTMYADDLALRPMSNGLIFDASDSGSAQYPVTVGSFGTGRAKISAGDGIAINASNVSNFIIQNLTVVGTWNSLTGSGSNTGVGVEMVNTQPNNTKLPNIQVSNVEAKGFRWAGVRVAGWNQKSGFRNVGLVKINAHGNGDVGISFRADFSKSSTTWAHEKVFVSRSRAWGNSGIAGKGGNSGSGILLCDVNGGAVERNFAYENGAFSDYKDGGPVGIWAYDSNAITIQRNESYSNHTGSDKDGGGFDLDGGVTNSILQYNYAHDNDGPGFLLCQFEGARAYGNNVVRQNISHNDARKTPDGAITLIGNVTNSRVENNTIVMGPNSAGGNSGIKLAGVTSAAVVLNNSITATGGVIAMNMDDASRNALIQTDNEGASWTEDQLHAALLSAVVKS